MTERSRYNGFILTANLAAPLSSLCCHLAAIVRGVYELLDSLGFQLNALWAISSPREYGLS
jgi:hypothetical protein